MARSTPLVSDETLHLAGDEPVAVGSPAWSHWLHGDGDTFRFESNAGSFTARREQVSGGSYWYAYRRQRGRLRKAYLGRADELTAERLAQTAAGLAVSASPTPPSRVLPVLATKLAPPRPSRRPVASPTLLARLDAARGRIVLLVAPPGFGKTTLLTSWLAGIGATRRVAWLSLDAADNDLARFLTYLVAAIRVSTPEAGSATLALLQGPVLPPLEELLVPLLNDLAASYSELVLVLDDYQAVVAEPVHQALAFLAEGRPAAMTLVVTSRNALPLPLARLRARDALLELGPAELRFSSEQIAAFLTEVMGLDLNAASLAALEARTEGWVAGLQLAALALQRSDDVAGVIESFGGGHRYVLDYLTDEVLRHQPPAVQDFLLRTAVLDTLSAPLCDTLLESTSSAAMLDYLEQASLFLLPLDGERQWYRYHQLFADVLRTRLRQTQPEQPAMLHRRASDWFAERGDLAEAVRHALAAADWSHAADLIDQAARPLLVHSECTTLLGWLNALPSALVEQRSALCMAYSWALLATGQLDAVSRWVAAAELLPEAAADDLAGEIDAVRATEAGLRRDRPEQTIALAHSALARLSEAKAYIRAVVALMLGAAYYQLDDMVASGHAFAEARLVSLAAGNTLIAVWALRQQAEIAGLCGRLRRAATIYREAIALADDSRRRGQPLPVVGAAYVGLGEVLRARDDLAAASTALRQGIALGEQVGSVEVLLRGYSSLALVQQAQGDAASAQASIEQALHLAGRTNVPRLAAWMRQVQARLWLLAGQLDPATIWAEESGLSADDPLSLVVEADYITLALVWLTQASRDPALPRLRATLHLLDRLLQAAQAAGRLASSIEILVLQALALDVARDQQAALQALSRALTLAEAEGYTRLFHEAGPAVAALLHKIPTGSAQAAYTARLLGLPPAPAAAAPPAPPPELGAEPLSGRELEVLMLIAAGLSNQEIADRLVVAISTVKKHINSIYGKLDVRSRTQALLKARGYRLIP